MMTPLFPSCTRENFYNFYLWVSVLPFNALRCLVASLITVLVYKHVSRAINRLNARIAPKQAVSPRLAALGRTLVVLGVILAALIFAFFAVLRYLLAP